MTIERLAWISSIKTQKTGAGDDAYAGVAPRL